jgi:hypothetical protein
METAEQQIRTQQGHPLEELRQMGEAEQQIGTPQEQVHSSEELRLEQIGMGEAEQQIGTR